MTEHCLIRSGRCLATLVERPGYCDRGRYHTIIDAPFFRSGADPAPRYYFDLERGKLELLAYLAAKHIEVDGAEWVAIPYPTDRATYELLKRKLLPNELLRLVTEPR